jgi:hypothetical protein
MFHRPQLAERTSGRHLLWAGLGIVAILVQLPALAPVAWPPRDIISDFYQDWASARNPSQGLPVYAEHAVTVPRYIGRVDPVCMRNRVNAHPPTSVLLTLPFAGLDYRAGLLAWNLASLGLLGVSLAIVGRQLAIRPPAWAVLPASALLMFCRPLVQQLIHGQWNLVLLVLVVGAWAADRSDRPRLAGALVGAATAIKLFPGFLFLYFLLRRRWSALVAGFLTLAALTCLTVAVLGAGAYRDYARDVLPQLGSFRSSWFNSSLVGFWTRLFDPATQEEHVEPLWRSAAAARAGILISWAAVTASVTWVVLRAWTRRALDHAFGLAVTGMLLLSPTTWDHGFLLLLLPVAVLGVDPPRSCGARLGLITALAALWLWQKPFCHAVIPGGISDGMARPVHTLTVIAYPSYALVLLFAMGAARATSGGGVGWASRQEPTASNL